MSTKDLTDDCYVKHNVTYHTLSWLMIGEFTLGLPLNLSVLFIFIFRFKFWKNKSILLFNIVVADFLLVICLPVRIHNYQHGLRRSGENAVCKTMLFMLFLNRGASITFLITLTIDRYFNVVHLGRRNFVRRLKKSPAFSIIIWVLLLPLTVPTMLQKEGCCNSLGRVATPEEKVVDTLREVVFFSQILVPFVILVYCTVRIVHRLRKKTVGEKAKLRRAVWLVMSVAVVFSICFLPCAVGRAVLMWVRLMKYEEAEVSVVQVYDSLMVLSYTDCLLDPLVYCLSNTGFKNAYVSTFCPTFLQKRLKKYDVSSTTGTNTATTSAARKISLPLTNKGNALLPKV
ncbi:hydroxycarboxylic acid receptor 2 [Pleuronectes platessa]|uniref:hydroxycarboxylic acid receptor 2 n=1 Tax=Pleuronectes platessa TaxID=8262 RepID=UPI00232A2A74|nr:hydroxycarboxylic acid receptor 2 [Pleuronectes platessa]